MAENDHKAEKENNMTNNKSQISISLNIILLTLIACFIAFKPLDKNKDTINNSSVHVEYVEHEKGDYSLIIKTKDDTNLQISDTLVKGINTNSVTLNGLSVDKYRYIWKADLEPAGLKFQWETNKGE